MKEKIEIGDIVQVIADALGNIPSGVLCRVVNISNMMYDGDGEMFLVDFGRHYAGCHPIDENAKADTGYWLAEGEVKKWKGV